MDRTLSDTIMAACANAAKQVICGPDPAVNRREGSAIKTLMRESRRFFIDEDVTRAATYLGVQHPEVLTQMLANARLPFEKCWFEWDNRAQVEESGSIPDEDSPLRAGCFVRRLDEHEPLYQMTVCGQVAGARPGTITVSPISVVYHLQRGVQLGAELAPHERMIHEISRLPLSFMRRALIGSAYVSLRDETDDERRAFRVQQCDNLVEHARYIINPFFMGFVQQAQTRPKVADAVAEAFRNEIVEQAGTWRFVIALIALINARRYVQSDTMRSGGGSRLASGKIVPYLDHWTVNLKIPRATVQRRVIREAAEAIPKRRHEVIGHWRHSRTKWPGLPDCEHVFVAETATHEVCAMPECGHRRWWVNDHARGDANVGFVTKDRMVTRDE